MKRTTLLTWVLVFAVATVAGCQSGPRFAWWKNDKAPDDTSAVARSASPTGKAALPSAQTKPEAVAVAGLTPATPPSSSNLASAGTPIGGVSGALAPLARSAAATANGTPVAPSVPIPVTSSTLANAPAATYPTDNGLADRLVGTPSTKSSAPVPSATSIPTGGPYDPNGYKPSATLAAGSPSASAPSADRYGVPAPSPSAATAALPKRPAPLASDPADRYGATPSGASAAATPAVTPITDPTTLAADRYANPTLPTMSQPAGATVSAASAPSAAPAVRLATAPGQYRPGRTSSFTGASATTPIEVARRPSPPTATSPPSATMPAAPNPSGASGAASQPWTPPAPAAVPPATTRTY